MDRKITLLDGAVGTSLWKLAEENGVKKAPVWKYNIEHPELVHELTRRYRDAGSEIILTNTFGANRAMVKRQSPYTVEQVVRAAVSITREELAGSGRTIAFAAGPLSEFMEPYGDLEEEDVEEIYTEMFRPGVEEGAQVIMLQTFMDLGMMRVACRTAKKFGLPVYCTMTFEASGKTLMGNMVASIVETLENEGADGLGMNCSLGPDKAVSIIREFKQYAHVPLLFKPNAGLPIMSSDGKTSVDYTPDQFVKELEPAFDAVDFIGGCCGTDDSFIRVLGERLRG